MTTALSRSIALSSALEHTSSFLSQVQMSWFFSKAVFNLGNTLEKDQTLSVTQNAFPEHYFHKQKIWKLKSQVGSVSSKYYLHFCEVDNHLFNMAGITCVILFNGCYKCSAHTEKRSQLVWVITFFLNINSSPLGLYISSNINVTTAVKAASPLSMYILALIFSHAFT